jgi:MFS family permease
VRLWVAKIEVLVPENASDQVLRGGGDGNRTHEPLACHASALPTELRPRWVAASVARAGRTPALSTWEIVLTSGHNEWVSRHETTEGLWAPSRRALTVGLVMTVTIIASEALSVVTIMPLVARDLGGLSLYGWVFSAFMLASLVGIVAAGRQADRRGPAQPYLAGLVLFSAGLVVAGTAPSMPVLVLGRVLQGLGAGAVPAVAYVAIGRSLPDRLRPKMMAVLSTAWVLPGLFGPAISAEVAHRFSWRWVFLGLLPLVLAAGPVALPALLRLGRAARDSKTEPAPGPKATADRDEHRLADAVFTAAGAGLVLGGLAAANLLLGAALVVLGLALGLPALRRLLPTGTLGGAPGLPATILSRGLLTFAFFGSDAFITLAITTVRHRSTFLAGVAVTTGTLTWTIGAWVQARVSRVTEGRRLVRIGLTLILFGIVGTAFALRPPVPVAVAVVAWSVAGLGIGLAYAPLSLMMLRESPLGREGWASASLNLVDVLGTALGVGFGGAAIAVGSSTGRALSTGITVAFAVAAAGAVVGLVVARRLPVQGVPVRGVGGVAPRPPRRLRSWRGADLRSDPASTR